MKIAIIYYSQSGNTAKMAQCIQQGMADMPEVEARIFSMNQIDAAFIKECSGIVIGTPTYYGTYSGEVKMWMENLPKEYCISNKVIGAFATAGYVHGGGESAIQGILQHLLCYGALIYSGGNAYGSPVIHFGPVAISSELEKFEECFQTYGKRFATKLLSL